MGIETESLVPHHLSPMTHHLRLVAGLVRGLAVEPERLDHRAVSEGEEDRLPALAGVLVPGPGRHYERVALHPVEPLASDDAVPAALGHVVHGAGRVAVSLRVLVLAQQLEV